MCEEKEKGLSDVTLEKGLGDVTGGLDVVGSQIWVNGLRTDLAFVFLRFLLPVSLRNSGHSSSSHLFLHLRKLDFERGK